MGRRSVSAQRAYQIRRLCKLGVPDQHVHCMASSISSDSTKPPQYMALPGQVDFNAGSVPPILPQRECLSQVSEQPGLHPTSVASKGKKPRERWTTEEHERFLEGLKMFNRDWKSIEKHVGTKTAVQIRSHAQKFFAKAEREPGTVDFLLPPPRPKRKPASATNPSKSGVSQCPSEAAPALQVAVPSSSGAAVPSPSGASAGALLGGLLQGSVGDCVSGSVEKLNGGPTDQMSKIAAAAISAASTTAHAVITAAGPEYLQLIQELAKHDKRLSFLACPPTDLVSSFSMQAPAETEPSDQKHSMQMTAAPASSCPMSVPMKAGVGLQPMVSTSLPPHCMSPTPATTAMPAGSDSGFPAMSSMPEPPVQLLNQLLSLPPASSQLISEHLGGPELAQHRDRLDIYGSLASTTSLTGNILLSNFNDSNTPETVTHAAPPLTTFTAPTPALPRIGMPASMVPAMHTLQGPPYSTVEPLNAVSMPVPSPPVSGQVQSTQHAIRAPAPNSSAHVVAPWQAVQLVQAQQQNQQHVFPKQQDLQNSGLPATTNGYGQQGSGGGSGGNSGGEMNESGDMNGSGDKSGSKSGKQSGNRKTQEPLEALPDNIEDDEAPECLPLGAMSDMPLLQPQGRLNSMQRTEFYKQYYHEMIRRGAEGLRNMNVELGSDDWLGPDGAPPIAGFPAPGLNANIPPGMEMHGAKRSECAPDVHGWTARKKQRTADTADMQNAALSNACEQPAASLGMVPCPPDANIFPLESGRLWEFHKGTGWAIEVEQQDTATSAQGHSRDAPGASRNTHPPDTSHKLQTSPPMAHPEVSQAMDVSPPDRNRPNSYGEGSNEPGVGCNHNDDGSGDGAKPGPGNENENKDVLLPPEQAMEAFKEDCGHQPASQQQLPQSYGSVVLQTSLALSMGPQ